MHRTFFELHRILILQTPVPHPFIDIEKRFQDVINEGAKGDSPRPYGNGFPGHCVVEDAKEDTDSKFHSLYRDGGDLNII